MNLAVKHDAQINQNKIYNENKLDAKLYPVHHIILACQLDLIMLSAYFGRATYTFQKFQLMFLSM